jgi:hypothetical protein
MFRMARRSKKSKKKARMSAVTRTHHNAESAIKTNNNNNKKRPLPRPRSRSIPKSSQLRGQRAGQFLLNGIAWHAHHNNPPTHRHHERTRPTDDFVRNSTVMISHASHWSEEKKKQDTKRLSLSLVFILSVVIVLGSSLYVHTQQSSSGVILCLVARTHTHNTAPTPFLVSPPKPTPPAAFLHTRRQSQGILSDSLRSLARARHDTHASFDPKIPTLWIG